MQICWRVIFSASPDPLPPRGGENVSDSKFDSFDDSALVGLSTQSLKRLSINAGSLVVINNIDISIQRIAQVVVLDPPPKTTTLDDASLVLDSLHTMLVFPTYDLMMTQQLLSQEVAYLSPMLAFNLGLHVSCLKSLVHRGNEVLEKYFVAKFDEGESAVIAMEPSNERFLRVSHYQTALVLGGTVSSGLPPDLLVSRSKVPMPLQEDAVNVLASVLSPPLCPSALSSKLRVAVLLHGLPGCGKRTVVNYVARRLGLHVVEYSCHSLLSSSERKTSTALAHAFNMARRYTPTILLLHHFDVFKNLGSQDGSQGDRVGVASEIASVIRELTEPVSNGEYSSMEEESNDTSSVDEVGKFRGHQVLLIASAESTEGLSPTIRRCFIHEIRMGSLNDEQRSEMLSQSLQGVSQLLNTSSDEFVKELVGQTSGFLPRDLRALVADAGANLFNSKESETEKMNSLSGDHVGDDVDQSSQLDKSNETLIPKEDFTKALDRSKKRNASALGAPKVPNVKWDDVGGLEDVKTSILDTVQLPLLHKDLFSSGLRKRSGVLLYGPPGTGKDLFIIGASNRPDLIDPALLRPGRFDKLLYVGVNADASYRERVLKALTRKFKLSEDVSLYSVAKKCPSTFTGADMYALCADAWFQAAKRGAKYGGYGSFLSMYQRSPVCKSPPPQGQHQVVSGSKCSASSAVPQVSVSGSTSKAPPASDVLVKSSNIGTSDSKPKSATKPSSSGPLNHKTFRLRIKVGSSDLSSPKNVSTYNSKQGFNTPPSTSEGEEGLLNGIHDSPTKILMAIVSFPLHKDQLLSPLSDDLIQLGKKEKIITDSGYVSVNKSDSKPELEKVSKSETRNEDQILKSELPEAHKSQKGSSRNSLRGKDTAVNISNTAVVDKYQEDIGGSEDVCEGLVGDSGESKEQEQSSLVIEAKKEKLSEENALKESLDSVQSDEEACKHLPLGVGSERELSGTCKKPKTGKSRFSSVDQPGSNKTLDGVNKTMITQASAHKLKDIAKASSHDGHEDRKRKQEENKASGDCMRLREAAAMESAVEKVRKKKRLKGSSCDKDRGSSQENGRDSASHLPIRASSPSLLCKDLSSEIIKTNVHEVKGSLVDTPAPSALDPLEPKPGRNSEGDEHHDIDFSAGDALKRCRDGQGYSTMDNPGTTKEGAQSSKDTAVEVKTKESRSKKIPTRKVSRESNKEGSKEYQDPDTKLDTNGSHFHSPQNSDKAKTIRGKSNHLEVTAEKVKNKPSPPVEVLGHGTEISNTKEQMMRNDNHSSLNQKQNGSTHKDDDVGSSPLKKESTCQTASNSIKEATDLKHMADRLKNVVSNQESTSVYFQAALKFLHGASLLESSGSIARSNDIYGSTSKLCEFCAHEYEKNKDMGAAALAYKCMEVAYLRITYSSHGNINRYRSELQAALQEIPSGGSPSFASDGENPNQTLAAEKAALSNTVRSSPRVTGNHVLSSGNNFSLSQLLSFSQNVSYAMDASRKAQTAFAIAKGISSGTRYSSNGIASIKRALDFDFQDMEKLLRVVRLAMESINM
uniref:AAA+ ATPase domain-containing protein n=1 Tax=Brassica campestris TaxID=3711 RepID=M4EX29_BRACM